MEQYEIERTEAVGKIPAAGGNPDEFEFNKYYLPPDPDGAGMFTVQYEVTISNKVTAKSLKVMGGIGWDWVGQFEEALKDGYFKA